jgi:hypothetical protein
MKKSTIITLCLVAALSDAKQSYTTTTVTYDGAVQQPDQDATTTETTEVYYTGTVQEADTNAQTQTVYDGTTSATYQGSNTNYDTTTASSHHTKYQGTTGVDTGDSTSGVIQYGAESVN